MAVVAFTNGGDLFGVNNANAVLAHNIGTHGARLQLANTRTIPFTPTAGTMAGVVLCFDWTGITTTTITAKLQFFNGSTWVDVAGTSRTATAAQITRGLIDLFPPLTQPTGQFDYYFSFPTPAVVTNVANTWRIDVTTASFSGNLYVYTSDGTNIFFVAVSTTPTTFVTNQDQPVITNSQKVSYSSSARFLGILPTGSTTRAVCGFVGSGVSGNHTDVDMLCCDTNGITTTINGYMSFCTYAAPRYGTSTTPLTNHVINFDTATFGTARNTGFTTIRADAETTSIAQKISWFMYGSVPAVEDTYLTANVPVGATSMEVAHDTGWVNGDRIDLGGQSVQGIGDLTVYTVTSVSGKTINFTPAIAATGGTRLAGATGTLSIASPCVATWSSGRGHGLKVNDEIYFRTTGVLPTGITAGTKYYVTSVPTMHTFTFSATLGGAAVVTTGTQSGVHTICVGKYAGRVIRMNGYGIVLRTNIVGGVTVYLGAPSSLRISGVQVQDIFLCYSTNFGRENDHKPWQLQHIVSNCSYENTTNPTAQGQFLAIVSNPQNAGFILQHVNARRGSILGSVSYNTGGSQVFTMEDCINLKTGFTSSNGYGFGAIAMTVVFRRNHFEGSNVQITLAGSLCEFRENRVQGAAAGSGGFRINTMFNSELIENIFDNNFTSIAHISSTLNTKGIRQIFGPLIQDTNSLGFFGGFIQYEEADALTHFNLNQTGLPITISPSGSIARVSNYPGLINDNRMYAVYGNFQSCGTGLPDTTVRTAGGYSLRFEPTNGANIMVFPNEPKDRAIPTGNIQNRTMTVGVWVYIANSAYSAGVHTKPTLKVKYDNATVVSTVATATYGAWQLLSLTFTPLTMYGKIDMWLEASTDAVGTNRHFYIDDMFVNYPAGYALNLGGLDLWAEAQPVWPPIATFQSPSTVWDAQLTNHSINGSFGAEVKKISNNADLSAIMSIANQ